MKLSFTNLNEGLSLAGAILLFILMLIVVANVLLRNLGYPFPGVLEFSRLCLVIVIFSGLAYCQAKGEHVRVRMVLNRLSPKVQFSLELSYLVLALGLCLVFVWQSGIYAWVSYLEKEFSFGLIEYPTWVPKVVIAVGVFAFGLAILIELIERAVGKRS